MGTTKGLARRSPAASATLGTHTGILACVHTLVRTHTRRRGFKCHQTNHAYEKRRWTGSSAAFPWKGVHKVGAGIRRTPHPCTSIPYLQTLNHRSGGTCRIPCMYTCKHISMHMHLCVRESARVRRIIAAASATRKRRVHSVLCPSMDIYLFMMAHETLQPPSSSWSERSAGALWVTAEW